MADQIKIGDHVDVEFNADTTISGVVAETGSRSLTVRFEDGGDSAIHRSRISKMVFGGDEGKPV